MFLRKRKSFLTKAEVFPVSYHEIRERNFTGIFVRLQLIFVCSEWLTVSPIAECLFDES